MERGGGGVYTLGRDSGAVVKRKKRGGQLAVVRKPRDTASHLCLRNYVSP